MKRVMQHTRNCPRKKTGQQGSCSICKQVIKLFMIFQILNYKFQFIALCCYHAKRCSENACRMPYCSLIKNRLKQQREFQRQNNLRLEINVDNPIVSSPSVSNVINPPMSSSIDNQSPTPVTNIDIVTSQISNWNISN